MTDPSVQIIEVSVLQRVGCINLGIFGTKRTVQYSNTVVSSVWRLDSLN